jgi:hypothetical protein
VAGGLLVPRVDDSNVLVVAALKDGVDVPSVEAKDVSHSNLLQYARYSYATSDCHRFAPFAVPFGGSTEPGGSETQRPWGPTPLARLCSPPAIITSGLFQQLMG